MPGPPLPPAHRLQESSLARDRGSGFGPDRARDACGFRQSRPTPDRSAGGQSRRRHGQRQHWSPANTATVQVAVTITQSVNSAGASLSGAQQSTSAARLRGLCRRRSRDASERHLRALAAGMQTPPDAQSQTASDSAAQSKPASTSDQTSNSVISTSNAALSAAVLLTAHDAVFSQIEEGRCGVIDGFFADAKAGSDADLLAAGLDLGQLGVSATSTSQPQGSRRSTKV